MKVQVCTGRSCKSKFSEYIIKRLKNDIVKFGYKDLKIENTLCVGGCKRGPNVLINGGDVQNYQDPAKVATRVYKEIIKK